MHAGYAQVHSSGAEFAQSNYVRKNLYSRQDIRVSWERHSSQRVARSGCRTGAGERCQRGSGARVGKSSPQCIMLWL